MIFTEKHKERIFQLFSKSGIDDESTQLAEMAFEDKPVRVFTPTGAWYILHENEIFTDEKGGVFDV